MEELNNSNGWRDQIQRQGEDAVGWLAQEVLDNQVLKGAVQGVTDAGQKVFEAREMVFGVLDLSSASETQKLIRRLRSVSQRLEDVEDGFDRLSERTEGASSTDVAAKISGLEDQLEVLAQQLQEEDNKR